MTVNYLYYPPVLVGDVHSYVKSDEGFAKIVNVLPTPQPSPWLARTAMLLIMIGAATVVYALGELVRLLSR